MYIFLTIDSGIKLKCIFICIYNYVFVVIISKIGDALLDRRVFDGMVGLLLPV